jgi:hypothetical protein
MSRAGVAPLGPRQIEVLAGLRRRGALTARQAEYIIRAGDMLRRWHAAALHGADDPWVADLARQILRRIDRLDEAANDLGHSSEGRRILFSLVARGRAASTGGHRWDYIEHTDDDRTEEEGLVVDLLKMLTSRAA